MSWQRYPTYAPVAERRRRAARSLGHHLPPGVTASPVPASTRRTIAHTFWGRAWCDNLESYRDYANRLPRGRTYVRNGSVMHLQIERGAVEALVSGSELYEVSIHIAPLPEARWGALRKEAQGGVDTLVSLLKGELKGELMRAVTSRRSGLFPAPAEITFHCSCPDWARMCKHVAAVLYGVGARLDTAPELLFLLRGVDPAELLGSTLPTGDGGLYRLLLAEGALAPDQDPPLVPQGRLLATLLERGLVEAARAEDILWRMLREHCLRLCSSAFVRGVFVEGGGGRG